MDFMQEYEKWLHSPALSPEEHAELESIKDDPKEIESRFFGPLEFGTAGLRGTMYTGLHNMNIHVIRWATQGFADVIAAEGEEGKRRGVAICMDCRNHSMEFARAAAELASARHLSHGLGRTKRLAHIRLNAHDELALQGLNQRINGHVRLNLSQNSLLRHRTLTFKPSLAYRSTLRSSFTSICGTSEGALGSYVYFNDARRCSAAPISGASPPRDPMRLGVS